MLPVFVVTWKADQTTGGGTIAGGGMFFGLDLHFALLPSHSALFITRRLAVLQLQMQQLG